MIQSLVEGQLVQRHSGLPDRRTVCLEITAKGHRVLEIARKATIAQLASQIGLLEANKVGQLKEAMAMLLQVVAVGNGQRQPQEKASKC